MCTFCSPFLSLSRCVRLVCASSNMSACVWVLQQSCARLRLPLRPSSFGPCVCLPYKFPQWPSGLNHLFLGTGCPILSCSTAVLIINGAISLTLDQWITLNGEQGTRPVLCTANLHLEYVHEHLDQDVNTVTLFTCQLDVLNSPLVRWDTYASSLVYTITICE